MLPLVEEQLDCLLFKLSDLFKCSHVISFGLRRREKLFILSLLGVDSPFYSVVAQKAYEIDAASLNIVGRLPVTIPVRVPELDSTVAVILGNEQEALLPAQAEIEPLE